MAKAKGKSANIFVWIILGLLIIGLAGFGVDGFGGSVRSIGKVGDRDIPVHSYFRALQQEIRAIEQQTGQALPFREVQAMGLDRAVLAQVVTVAALENEAERLGVSVGDETVRDEVLAIPAFRSLDGSFDREAYRFVLQQEGWSEREFEDRLRLELARGILQSGAVAGAPAPRAMTDLIHGWLGERRTIDVITLDRSDLAEPVPAPTDAQLRAFHSANPDLFTLPEARRITYAWLTPEMLMDEVEIDDAALREAYRLRAAEFDQPERRIVERLVFADATTAAAARARIDSGEADFSEIVAERGLALEDTDMGDVTEADLGEAGSAVFALPGPGVVGPLPSPFGPALYNVVAILAAQQIPFEDAVPELRESLALDRARRIIADRFDDYEDILAGGATLEQLARETALETGRIDLRPDSRDGIAAYEAFRSAAEAVRQGDFAEMRPLEGGGVFALRLDEIVPPAIEPFDDVVVRVIEGWDLAEARDRVLSHAEEVLTALQGNDTPETLGLLPDTHTEVLRRDRLPDLPPGLLRSAFAAAENEWRLVQGRESAVHLVSVREVLPAATEDAEAAATRDAIARELRASVAEDVFAAWARQLEREAGIRLDSAAIEAVHGQFR